MPYTNKNGAEIFYQVEGQGPPIILLPAFMGSLQAFYSYGFVDRLKDQFQVIGIDLRGLGESEKFYSPDRYSLKILIDDVIAVLKELNIEKTHVAGFSLGGWIGFGLMKYYPEQVLSFISFDGPPNIVAPDFLPPLIDLTEDEFDELAPDTPPCRKQIWFANDKKSLHTMNEWLVEESPSIVELTLGFINQINIPCLFLQSRSIEAGSIEEEITNLCLAENPNAKRFVFEDMDHSYLQMNSEKFVPMMKEFIASI